MNLTEIEIGVLIEALWASYQMENISKQDVLSISDKLEKMAIEAQPKKRDE